MGIRHYNAVSGRFLTVDLIPRGSANNCEYANQDPTNNHDPDGGRGCIWATFAEALGD